jgi:haloalkane dehalogenase
MDARLRITDWERTAGAFARDTLAASFERRRPHMRRRKRHPRYPCDMSSSLAAVAEQVSGRISAIELVNVNKARGQYSYNAELVIDRGPDVPRARLRLPARVHWRALSREERRRLAPLGPRHTLELERYRGFCVGQDVRLTVSWTSWLPEPLGLVVEDPGAAGRATSGDMIDVHEVLRAHEAAGKRFSAAGLTSFVLDEGQGDPVVCLHGVPASSFLYRKVLRELAHRGLRGIAFDLPGLGLAERPSDADYSFTGLGRFSVAAIDALGLDTFHLVVHDIGGPVGFEVAAAAPARVRSLTILNCIVRPDTFRRPWMMQPFAWRVLDRLWLATARGPLFRALMRHTGVADPHAITDAELDAYVKLLHRDDGGRAFLRIMKGFELTAAKRELYARVLADTRYPIQIIWGELDRALTVEHHGRIAREAAPRAAFHRLPAKHFLQEDRAAEIAELVAALARPLAGAATPATDGGA